jgi:hypothetical protein
LPQVWVRLTDQAGSLSIGSPVKADTSGDFSLVFKSCEIPAGAANLVVAAEDANGMRFATSDPVTLKAASPVYLELTLSSPAAAPAQPTTPGTPPPSPAKPA